LIYTLRKQQFSHRQLSWRDVCTTESVHVGGSGRGMPQPPYTYPLLLYKMVLLPHTNTPHHRTTLRSPSALQTGNRMD